MNRLPRALFGAVLGCLLVATASADEARVATQTTDFEQYMESRGPGDPDPTPHMRTLIDFARQNRAAAVKHCAAQKPPVPAERCAGGVPFCALIVDRRSDQVVAQACNHGSANPVLHGEIAAINHFANILQAQGISFSRVGRHHDLYTTGESCAMCMGAIMWANFHTVFFGSNLAFLSDYYAHIAIDDHDLAGRWVKCQGEEQTVRTRVVGGVLEEENNALFAEFGYQFCPAARKTQQSEGAGD